MDEITRCLEVLGLKPGATEAEVQQAYRELTMVWHPDRFAADSPLQAKAHAKLQEINAAYDYLLAHGFKEGVVVVSAERVEDLDKPDTEIAEEDDADGIALRRKLLFVVAGLCLVVFPVWLWFQRQAERAKQEEAKTQVASAIPVPEVASNASPATPLAETPPPPTVATIASDNLLPSLILSGKSTTNVTGEGTTINGLGWLHTREEYSPPFVIHAVAKTELSCIRLLYGQGIVILNWELNPSELRFHDPGTGQITALAGQGRVPANEWQELEWRVDTNYSALAVNGVERARITGNYSGLSELAGIKTGAGSTRTIQQFEVRKLAAKEPRRFTNQNAGLVLYFPFETEDNGTVTDQSGFKNNGAVHGAKFIREGKVGGAMAFDGSAKSGDSIVVRNSTSLDSMQRTRQLTICAWIKPNSLPSEYPVILSKGGNFPPKAFGGYEIDLRAVGEDGLNFVSGKYGLVCFHEGEVWFPKHLNEWIHIAVVINAVAGTGKLYINGERTDDITVNGNSHDVNFALVNDLIIGAPDPHHHENRAGFDGQMDEVRIYARALSGEEIRSLPGFDHPPQ